MADSKIYFASMQAPFTASNAFLTLMNLNNALADDAVPQQVTGGLELWSRKTEFMFCVLTGDDDAFERKHRSQMELEGWRCRA
ncbi:Uncharacterised protein [Mycobacteroides abscessus subsp. abscessus]|nr:Uncharacterised protein [Mycobacteroides abscessus subsp. abscessus]